jgi:hypothetical protein
MNETAMLRGGFVFLSILVAGCSSSSDNGGSPGSTDSGLTDAGGGHDGSSAADTGSGAMDSGNPAADSGTGQDAAGEGGTMMASVRVAHLSPDAPAVDLCVAVHGTTSFIGPVLNGAGASSGLAFGQVTKYLPVPAVQLDVRLVAPASTSCAMSLGGLPDITNLPALPAGASVTIAAIGDLTVAGSDPAFQLKAFVDDATVDSTKGALRFVHASPGTPAVDVGLESGGNFTAVFSNVAFGDVAAAGSPIDANGYYVGAPFTNQTVAARAHGSTTDALTIPGVSLPAGAIATAFAVGGKTGDQTHPLKVLLCVDNAMPNGLLASCM